MKGFINLIQGVCLIGLLMVGSTVSAAPLPDEPRPTVASSDVSIYLDSRDPIESGRLIGHFHAVPEAITAGDELFIADSSYRVCQVFSLELAKSKAIYVLSAHHGLLVQRTTGPCVGEFPRGLRELFRRLK